MGWWFIIKEDFRRSFAFWQRDQSLTVLLGLVVTLVLTALGTFGIKQTITLEALGDWRVLLSWFLFLLLIYTPIKTWKEMHDKYEIPQIELVVEENDKHLQKRGRNWIFRVGVRVLGIRTINNVEVTLVKIDGNENAYFDAPLRPAYSLAGDPSTFDLKPGAIRFVELFSWGKDDKNGAKDTELRVHYHQNYQIGFQAPNEGTPRHLIPFLLPTGVAAGKRVITLRATGENVPSATKDFVVNTEGDKPVFCEAKKITAVENG